MKSFTVKFINTKTHEEFLTVEVKARDKSHAIKKAITKGPDNDETYRLGVVEN